MELTYVDPKTYKAMSVTLIVTRFTAHVSATDQLVIDSRIFYFLVTRRFLRLILRKKASYLARLHIKRRRRSNSDCNHELGSRVFWSTPSRVCQWLPCHVLKRLYLRGISCASSRCTCGTLCLLGQHRLNPRLNSQQLHKDTT